MNNFSTLRANINRRTIFPPALSIEEALRLYNSKMPFRSNKDCHECTRMGEKNTRISACVASHLWKEANFQEKSAYTDLAQMIKNF
ncbi:hypothetical protein Glove_141g79 [Diversispora epigaea]|uniref:Uncharacterized protein n=1 Tax=Diversispora epigaea TaxID=1348612 RepID=A0A397IZB8_9GLOM|nr:hypothetical protein Glove_141g79 [Diversispora epigaea]